MCNVLVKTSTAGAVLREEEFLPEEEEEEVLPMDEDNCLVLFLDCKEADIEDECGVVVPNEKTDGVSLEDKCDGLSGEGVNDGGGGLF